MDSDTTDTPGTPTTGAPTTGTQTTGATGTQPTDAAPHDTSGTSTTPPADPSYRPEQRLHRGGRGRMLGGVALGLADYFDVDPTLVRIGFVALTFVGGLTIPLYLAGWLLIPDEDTDLSMAEELFTRERSRAW